MRCKCGEALWATARTDEMGPRARAKAVEALEGAESAPSRMWTPSERSRAVMAPFVAVAGAGE